MKGVRHRLVLGTLVVIGSVLAACGGSSAAPPTTTTSTTSTITVPSTTVPSAAVVSLSPCQTNQLQVSLGASDVALGNIGQTILFTNVSRTPCTASGYPGVAALNAHGGQAAQAIRLLSGMVGGLQNSTTLVPVVTLAPGQIGSAEIEGSDNPVGAARSCVYYPAFYITPPDDFDTAFVYAGVVQGSNIPGFPGCSPISVNPIVPGTTGRLN